MQTVSNPEFITGIFKQELKNRFLCEVNIGGVDTVCYVPSSCHLGNFLKLQGKKVILVPTQTTGCRTKFALYAIPYKRNFILLNPSIANKAVEENIQRRIFSFLGKRGSVHKEYYVDGYKSDLFLDGTKTIIEIKSVISTQPCAIFPTVYSERTLKQLQQLKLLMRDGYRACFCIISLNPYVKAITLNTETEFYRELRECIAEGMLLKAFSCRFKDGKLLLDKQLNLLEPQQISE